jgi:transposase
MAKDTLVADDLAKAVFEVAVSHHRGQVAGQKRYSRQQFPLALAQLPPSTVVMEACGSAHYWDRGATALVAFVGDIQRFPSGRHFASYLGTDTPRTRVRSSKAVSSDWHGA